MNILVGIDGGSQQRTALELGRRLADGGRLTVATVVPLGQWSVRLGAPPAPAVEAAAEEILRSAREQLSGVELETRAVADVSPPRALHRLALQTGADLLVVGACHRGPVGRVILGGTGERLVPGAPCPIVVAPRDHEPGSERIRTIGVAYDAGAESEAALRWASRLAEASGASVELLTAVEHVPLGLYPGVAVPPSVEIIDAMRADAERRLEDVLGRLPATPPVSGRVLDGAGVPSLVEAAAGVDLLVTGSRGYGPVGAVLAGSVSRALMQDAPCPVVVVPRSATAEDQVADPTHARAEAG